MSRLPPYTPLDLILELPATRLLRALRWFDWATPHDVYEAAGVGDHERSAVSAALSRLVKEGLIERGGRGADGVLHRLTAAGRVELARLLRGEGRMSRSKLGRSRRAA